jgi:hypothetical protein
MGDEFTFCRVIAAWRGLMVALPRHRPIRRDKVPQLNPTSGLLVFSSCFDYEQTYGNN